MTNTKSREHTMHEGAADAMPSEATEQANFNAEAFAGNLAKVMQSSGQAAATWLRAREHGGAQDHSGEAIASVVKALTPVMQYWMGDPQRSLEAQKQLAMPFFDLWLQTMRRLNGEQAEMVVPAVQHDKRFSDPSWGENAVFDFLRQAFSLSSSWMERMVEEAQGLEDKEKLKANFYLKQITSAMAPSNFPLTNPTILKETLETSGENLARGMAMFAEDLERGGGELKIRQTDPHAFSLGENIATTKGKVIYRNELIELIQYEPTTPQVLKRPLLIVPPWINKYYILDLTKEKSFVQWCVDQGLTVFLVSWVNPDERQAHKTFLDYIREGIFASLDVVHEVTGERQVSAVGYCVGGTLLSTALALMAAKGDDRIASATLLTTQVDFTQAGDLKIFLNEETIESVEKEMAQKGYLDSGWMSNAFNMLRPNDLIWPYVVQNYMKGKQPFPFDLLYWNSDSTRMPASNHSFYLRNFYMDNKLAKAELELERQKLDLKKVKIPLFNLATREDHIAPARSVLIGSSLFGGRVTTVIAASGHIAGVINPPAKKKYGYWTGGKDLASVEEWLSSSEEHKGSWWPYWFGWLKGLSPNMVPARTPGSEQRPAICDAPGTYVKSA